jgi:hypothetical protein
VSRFVPIRLTRLLTRELEDLEEENLRHLIGVREDEDLDFKEEPYGRGGEDSKELAADIASMANTKGGLIVIGISEESNLATDLSPIELPSEEEDLRIHQVAASLIFPRPEIRIWIIPSIEREKGYLAIAVPFSPLRPHAVRHGDRLRYVVRSGPGKRALTESEVADAYHSRFLDSETDVRHLKSIHEDGLTQLDRSARPWLVLSFVPSSRGHMEIRKGVPESLASWAQGLRETVPPPSWFHEVPLRGSTRMRCITLTDSRIGSPLASWFYAELYTDGSGFAAGVIGWERETKLFDFSDFENRNEVPESLYVIDDERLALGTADLLLLLGSHAIENAGTWGAAAVQAEIAPVAALPGGEESKLTLCQFRSPFGGPLRGTRVIDSTGASEHTLRVEDVAQPSAALISTSRLISSDLGASFGLPEIYQLSEEGRLRRRYFQAGERWAKLERWAKEYGIEVTEETL